MKGVDIVVGGDVGHMSAFMGQAGRLVIRGNAGEALGESIYETRLYVRGDIASLGADCVAKEMRPEHHKELEYCSSPRVSGGATAWGQVMRRSSATPRAR